MIEFEPTIEPFDTGSSTDLYRQVCFNAVARLLENNEKPPAEDPAIAKLSPLLRAIHSRDQVSNDHGHFRGHLIHQTPDEALENLRSINEA